MKLYYYGARYYDPYIGRFISRDPAGNGINWYVYCRNNPLALIDPAGLDPVSGSQKGGYWLVVSVSIENVKPIRNGPIVCPDPTYMPDPNLYDQFSGKLFIGNSFDVVIVVEWTFDTDYDPNLTIVWEEKSKDQYGEFNSGDKFQDGKISDQEVQWQNQVANLQEIPVLRQTIRINDQPAVEVVNRGIYFKTRVTEIKVTVTGGKGISQSVTVTQWVSFIHFRSTRYHNSIVLAHYLEVGSYYNIWGYQFPE